MTDIQEVTKNFNNLREQDEQLERVELRWVERVQATKLIEGWYWIREAVASSCLVLQTGT